MSEMTAIPAFILNTFFNMKINGRDVAGLDKATINNQIEAMKKTGQPKCHTYNRIIYWCNVITAIVVIIQMAQYDQNLSQYIDYIFKIAGYAQLGSAFFFIQTLVIPAFTKDIQNKSKPRDQKVQTQVAYENRRSQARILDQKLDLINIAKMGILLAAVILMTVKEAQEANINYYHVVMSTSLTLSFVLLLIQKNGKFNFLSLVKLEIEAAEKSKSNNNPQTSSQAENKPDDKKNKPKDKKDK